MPIIKTGITVKKENAWEFFNFLDSQLKDGASISFKTENGVMPIFDSLCRKEKVSGLLALKTYKNGLVHMAKVG